MAKDDRLYRLFSIIAIAKCLTEEDFLSIITQLYGPVVQLVRTPACHAGGRRFEPVLGRQNMRILYHTVCGCAAIAQSVERILGKDEVPGSNPGSSSKKQKPLCNFVAEGIVT